MDKFCTSCGAPLKEGDAFCQNCAAPVKVKSSISSVIKNFKLSKKHMAIFGGLLAVLLIGSVIFSGFGKGKTADESFQFIVGEENYLYYKGQMIEIDKDFYYINYNNSFVYKQMALLDFSDSVVLVDLKKGKYEVIKNVSSLSVSKTHGKFAYLDRDEVILRDLSKPSKEIVITDDVSRYYANDTFTRFYVIEDEAVLSVYGDNGKRIKEKIVKKFPNRQFYVVDDTYLIYEDSDVIIYNLKTEKAVEKIKNEYLSTVYDSKTAGNFIVETSNSAYVMTKDKMEQFDIGYLYCRVDEDIEVTWIQNYRSGERILFNLQGLNGKVDYEKVKLDAVQDVEGGVVAYNYDDEKVEVFSFKKGAAKPEKAKVSLNEDIDDMVVFDDKHMIYISDGDLFYYNGSKEFELPFDLYDVSDFYFDGSNGAYFILDDEVHYLSKNGKTKIVFDEEDIYYAKFSETTGDLMILDEDDQLYVINNGGKAKLVAKEVEEVVVSDGVHFYYVDDVLFSYVNGKSKSIGEDLSVRVR